MEFTSLTRLYSVHVNMHFTYVCYGVVQYINFDGHGKFNGLKRTRCSLRRLLFENERSSFSVVYTNIIKLVLYNNIILLLCAHIVPPRVEVVKSKYSKAHSVTLKNTVFRRTPYFSINILFV